MKIRLSYKDVLLLIGILVAGIIAFTVLVYRDPGKDEKQTSGFSISKPSAPVLLKKILKAGI